MMQTAQNKILSAMSPKVVGRLKTWRNRFREKRYFSQATVRIKCGAYELEVPEKHALVELQNSQPYRDLCIGIAAQQISKKYPDGTMVDIGANVGDTASCIATHAPNKMILIEGSDYFYEFLKRNAAQFPNPVQLSKALVSDGSAMVGEFGHWGGTACFRETEGGSVKTKSQQLGEVCDPNTCFVKIDTDGHDLKILNAGLEWLRLTRPAVLFENQIRNVSDLEAANNLFRNLVEIDYRYFMVWDDPGFFVTSSSSLEVLQDLNRYQYKNWQNPGRKSICNYDVLCLHQRDADLYASLSEWWRTY